MATLIIQIQRTEIPANGYLVKYRPKGSEDPYETLITLSNMISIPNLPDGVNYEGSVTADCGFGYSTVMEFDTDVCFCPPDFISSPDGSYCYRVQTVAPTINSSNVCFAPVTNGGNYSYYGTRIYARDLTEAEISTDVSRNIANIPLRHLDAFLQTTYWRTTGSASDGPMNRAGIWLDSDCNGTVDALTANAQATIAWSYNNTGPAKQVYIGVGADNQFVLQVNGATIARTTMNSSPENFRNWHVIPATFVNGNNIVNIIATGDGSTNDCVAFIVYDNTVAELMAATSDANLNILFSTATLRFTRWNIANCPTGFDLDTSGGVNNYVCRKLETTPCGV